MKNALTQSHDNGHKRLFRSDLISAKDGFIVQTMFIIFYILERVSIFYWIRAWGKHVDAKNGVKEKGSFLAQPIFPEIWAVGNALLAIMWVYVLPLIHCRWLIVIVGSYSIFRIFEMFVYQINVLLFHRMAPNFLAHQSPQVENPNNPIDQVNYNIKSATRTVVLLIFNIFEYVAQFAVVYAMAECLSKYSCAHIGIMDSFRLFMNISQLEMTGMESGFLMRIVSVETIVGIFVNIICLARFIGILPGVKELGYGTNQKEDTSNHK